MKRCIISLANERGNYQKALDRLEASVKQYNPEIKFFGFRSEDEVGAPKHLVNPYAFKVFAFGKAYEAGYRHILWLDSSVVLRKDITPIFKYIKNGGYIMQEAGCYVGEWTNDRTLNYFDVTRNESIKMPCYGNAGFLGLNFNHTKAKDFYSQWAGAMQLGLFKGEWNNNKKTESQDVRCKGFRHDLSVGSIIANKLNMHYQKGDQILQYSPPDAPLINDNIYFSAQGI